MSYAGHVLDMINRFNDNRNLKLEHRIKYTKLKKAYQKVHHLYPEFRDRSKLKPKELKKLKSKIRYEILRENRRALFIIMTFVVALVVIIYFAFKNSSVQLF